MHDLPGDVANDVFVLAGGASFGALQVGQLQALMEAGVVPDLIIGCSVGALNGAAAAGHWSSGNLERIFEVWQDLTTDFVFPGKRAGKIAHIARGHSGVCDTSGLRQIADWCLEPHQDIAELPIRCMVITTNFDQGISQAHTSGDATVLVASAALPGMFPPVVLDGERHVDGGVLDRVPVAKAAAAGARRIWVLDPSVNTTHWVPEKATALDVLISSFNLSTHAQSQAGTDAYPNSQVIALPGPDLGDLRGHDFSKSRWLMDAGYHLSVPVIATALAEPAPDVSKPAEALRERGVRRSAARLRAQLASRGVRPKRPRKKSPIS